jgi:UDP-N-acetylmuramate dehydrogenase
MMAAARSLPLGDRLIDRLPPVRGRLRADAPLGPLTWFQTGGPAEVLFRPADIEDLAGFLAACPAEVPVTVLGVGSNTLVRDGGVKGVVIRLGGAEFTKIEFIAPDMIMAGAAALDRNVAFAARDHGLAGMEFLSGIPGTIGGAARMNAGCYGREFRDICDNVTIVRRDGRIETPSAAECGFAYRRSALPDDAIVAGAVLLGTPGEKGAIAARIEEIAAQRTASQPRNRTGGSTFKNPPGHKSWELIDAAGCRGLKVGDAQVSEQHCNFLINLGHATAADIETLGETVRARVLETSGVSLDWEIRRIGEPAGGEARDG